MEETNTTLSQRLKEAKGLCEAELQKDTREKILKEQERQWELKRKAEEEETARKNAEAEAVDKRDRMIENVIAGILCTAYVLFVFIDLVFIERSIAALFGAAIVGVPGFFLVLVISLIIARIIQKIL